MSDRSGTERRIFSTLFPIVPDSVLQFRLRVLQVVEKLPYDSKCVERLNKVSGDLWRNVLKCPVKPFRVKEFPSFLVPEEFAKQGDGYSFLGPANRICHLELTDEVIIVDMDEEDLEHRDIVCDMLARSFSDRFWRLRRSFWRWNWSTYYRNLPENLEDSQRIVDVYRGLKYSVAWLDDLGIHLAADIRTKYIGRESLTEHRISEDLQHIEEHLKTERKRGERGSCFIRDNRVVKYSCYYAGDSEVTAGEYAFKDSTGRQRTVREYYKQTYNIDIPKDDPIVFVKDNEYRDPIPAPASRLFPAFDTDQMKRLHKILNVRRPPSPQLAPQTRVERIREILNEIKEVNFGDTTLTLGTEPISEVQRLFIPPNLLYGNAFILRYGEISRPEHSNNPERLITDWIKSKMTMLYRNGIYKCSALPGFILWMPSKWRRDFRNNMIHFLEDEMKRQSKDRNLKLKPRLYESTAHILEELNKSRGQHVLHIIGLAFGIPATTHPRIKQIPEINSQCFSESTAERISEQGFCRNLALAVLIDAGAKPWVLETELNYDVYIGVDVLENKAAFHFFWGPGAKEMLFKPGRSVSQARHQEAIKAPHMNRYLSDGLNHIYSGTSQTIRSITIHRDGRWWPSEQDGFERALKELKKSGTVAADCRIAVVEIRKTHLPVRLMMKKRKEGHIYFSNPVPGVFRVLNRNQLLMVTTWNPIRPEVGNGRTSGVLMTNIVHSEPDHSIEDVGRDVYNLTQLNWSAPGIEINVPVTIRWADHKLREELPRLAEAEEDDLYLEDEADEEEDEFSA